MRAVGQAHVQTGAPITVHTHAHSQSGLVAGKKVFAEEVDLTKVVIGHSGDSTDLDYLCALADAGSYLGMDRFGLDMLPFEQRVVRGGARQTRLRREDGAGTRHVVFHRLVLPRGQGCRATELEADPHQRRRATRAP